MFKLVTKNVWGIALRCKVYSNSPGAWLSLYEYKLKRGVILKAKVEIPNSANA